MGVAYIQVKHYASFEYESIVEVNFEHPERYLKQVSGEHYLLAYEIIKRESGWNEVICNRQYGCKSGMGLFQIIPSTLEYCENILERHLDAFYYKDNIDCGIWLLTNEGIGHWNPYSGPY